MQGFSMLSVCMQRVLVAMGWLEDNSNSMAAGCALVGFPHQLMAGSENPAKGPNSSRACSCRS